MTLFWVLAAIMLVVSVGVIVVPILRSQEDNEAGDEAASDSLVAFLAAVYLDRCCGWQSTNGNEERS